MKSGNREHERIDLVDRLWEIECLHLLGLLSGADYRRALAAAHGAPPGGQPVEIAAHEEVYCG